MADTPAEARGREIIEKSAQQALRALGIGRPTPEEQIEGMRDYGDLLENGLPAPVLTPDFTGFDLSEYITKDIHGHAHFDYETSPSIRELANQVAPLWYNSGKIPKWEVGATQYPPIVAENLYMQEMTDEWAAHLTELEEMGLTVDDDDSWITHIDLLTGMKSGVSPDNRAVWEANTALWKDQTAALRAYGKEREAGRALLEAHQAYNIFAADWGGALGQDRMDVISTLMPREIDEFRIGQLMFRANQNLSDNQEKHLANDQTKNQFVAWFIAEAGRLSQSYQIETGALEPGEDPGIVDAVKAIGGTLGGIADFILPDELVGDPFTGGSIMGGPGTVLGWAAGTPGIEQVLGGLGTLWEPANEYVTRPFMQGVSNIFAQGFRPFGLELSDPNPYRVYATMGQNIATSLGAPYGSPLYTNMSGAFDVLGYVVGDPIFLLGGSVKGLTMATRIPLESGRLAARLAQGSKPLTKNQLINRMAMPYLGKSLLPAGFTGMRGPYTRIVYTRFAKTADELSRSPKAMAAFENMYNLGRGGDIGRLLGEYRVLENAPNLADYIVNHATDVEDVRQVWVKAMTTGLDAPAQMGALEAKLAADYQAAANAVRGGLATGTLGARDLVNLRFGPHKWSGRYGYKLQPDGSYDKVFLNPDKAGTGERLGVFGSNAVVANIQDLRKLAQRPDAPWILRNVVNSVDQGTRTTYGQAKHMLEDLNANLAGHSPRRLADARIKGAFDDVRARLAAKRDELDRLMAQPTQLRSKMNRIKDEIVALQEEQRQITAKLTPEDFRGVSEGTGQGARALGERAFQDVLTEYLRAFGFDGFSLGSKVWLDRIGSSKLMDAVDTSVGNGILAKHFMQEAETLSKINRLVHNPDELSWIINLPIPTQSATVLKKLKAGAAVRVNRWLPEETVRGLRRRKARFTRITDDFPQSVSLHDTKRGIQQLRHIGERIGMSPEEIQDIVTRYTHAPWEKRHDVLTEIRAEMVELTQSWRYKHRLDGMFIDGGEFEPGRMPGDNTQIARMESSSEAGKKVGAPWLPSYKSQELDFFRADFYKEMERVNVARRLSKVPFGSKIVEGFGFMGLGARERRANLVNRWTTMIENRVGKGSLSEFEKADIYNQAFAAHLPHENGLGLISRAGNLAVKTNRLLHSQFSINALAQRATSWMHKVAIVEEPIRLAIGGIINQFANPPGALKNMMDTFVVRKIQRNADILVEVAPQARAALRTKLTARLDDPSLAEGKDILRVAVDELGEEVKDFLPAKTKVKNLTTQQVWNAVDSYVNRAIADADLSVGGRVTSFTDEVRKFQRQVDNVKKQRLSRLAFDEGEMTLDDILNIGFESAAREIGHSIFQNTVFDEFIRGFDNSRGLIPLVKHGAQRKQFAQAKAGDLITIANDPYFRIAAQRMLDKMHGVTPEPIRTVISRSQWGVHKPYARRMADEMVDNKARNLSSDEALATWYFDEFLAERAIPAKVGLFWMDEATGKPDVARMEATLQGVLDRRIDVDGVVIPLGKNSEKLAASRLDTVLDNGYQQGKQWVYAEQAVQGTFNPHQGWAKGGAPGEDWGLYDHAVGAQHKLNIVHRKLIEFAGARASEVISRQPGWRRVFADYKRHYENLGWAPEDAKAAAQIQATKTINTLMYNAREMNNFLKSFNSVVPFGAAMYEVMNVWMRQLPKDNVAHGGLIGWTIGSVALQQKFGYAVQALEALGIVERDEEGNPIVKLDTKGRWASQALAAVYGAPQRFVNMIASLWDVSVPNYEGMTLSLGTPFQPLNPDNAGLMAVSNFSLGLSPPAAFAANKIFSSTIGASRAVEFEGGSIATLLEQMDVSPIEFFSDPRNRSALRNMGVDPELFNQLATRDDSIQVALLVDALKLDTELKKGTFYMPNTGALRDFAGNFVFPYGAPNGLPEVLAAYTPSAVQNMLRSFEMMFNEGEAPIAEWFLGPVSAYRTEGGIVEGVVIDHINRGTLDIFMGLHQQIIDLRQEALDKGYAYMDDSVDEPGFEDRFTWDDKYGDEHKDQVRIQNEIRALQTQVAEQEEITLENAVNIAIAQGFGKAFTQLALPTSPQTYTENQRKVQEFWASREMAEAFFPDRNPDGTWKEGTFDPQARQAAWTRFLNTTGENWADYMDVLRAFLTPHQWTPGDKLDGSESWGIAPVSDAKRQFLEAPGNDLLHYYLTPSKVYPQGYTSAEDVSEFFERVQDGQIAFADPSVFLMRGWTSQLNWDQGAERQAFVEKNGGTFRAFTDNWYDYMEMIQAQKNQRDYLDFIDDKLEMGYNEARKLANEMEEKLPDAEAVIRDHVLTDRRRTQATLGRLLDDVDTFVNLAPEELAEMKSALFQIKALTDDLVGQGAELDKFYSRTQEERDLDTWFDTVINPHSQVLARLYDAANSATIDHVQKTIFDNIRFYENTVYDSTPEIRGIDAPNPYTFRLNRMLDEVEANEGEIDPLAGTRLEISALRQLAYKVDWLSKSDIDVIDAYVRLKNPNIPVSTDSLYPHSDEEWSIYSLRNTIHNNIEQGRISGLYTDTEAGKMKRELKEHIDEILIEAGRGAEVDFQKKTPANQLYDLGILPSSLEDMVGWSNSYLEQEEALRAADAGGIDDLWRLEYWPSMFDWLSGHTTAQRDLQRLGGIMYKESNDLLFITRRLFLGKYGNE